MAVAGRAASDVISSVGFAYSVVNLVSKPGRDIRDLLREIERDSGNVSLRVSAAAALRNDGRIAEAVAMYKIVVQSYVASGRLEQAKIVARSALELAPGDSELRAVLDPAPTFRVLDATVPLRDMPIIPQGSAVVMPLPVPATTEPDAAEPRSRNSQYTPTPLPAPMPYHVAEPTRVSWVAPYDAVEDSLVETDPMLSNRLPRARSNSGLSAAARKITEHFNSGSSETHSKRPSSSGDEARTQRISRVNLALDDDDSATRPIERVDAPAAEDESESTPARS